MAMDAGLAAGTAGEATLPPLARLAIAALPGLNAREGTNFVGVTEQVSFGVSDEAARESIPRTRDPGAQAGEVRRHGSTPAISRSELEALIAREYAGLRLLLCRRIRDPELAADILNDAICTSWEKWQAGEIENPELIAGYVFRVAMNLMRNQRRSVGDQPERRAAPQQLDHLSSEPGPDPVEQGITRKVLQIVREMTPLRDRMVIVRFYLEEEDRESICRDLGLTLDQFNKVLHRARRRLRELAEARGIRRNDLFSMLLVIG